MNKNKSVLLYNLYPLYNWKGLTDILLAKIPHKDIFVHINIPKRNPVKAIVAYRYLKKNEKVLKIFFSINLKSKGESTGFEVFRKKINFNNYEIVSYIHSKGSSRKRKNTQQIKDWTELLRYFIVERLDLAQRAFENDYFLFGVNLLKEHMIDRGANTMLPESKFHYSGNFVTLNLKELRKEFLNVKCSLNYYGVEAFWGSLCDIKKAYSVHQSNVDHYQEVYPQSIYK